MSSGSDDVNANVSPNEYIETPVKTIFKKFANQRDVSLVYGEPIELGLQKVVPVAEVKYAVGGGGDGSGGAFKVKPIGVYIITPDRVKFQSTIDVKRLTALTVAVGGILGLISILKEKR